MARKHDSGRGKKRGDEEPREPLRLLGALHPDIKRSILGITFLCIGLVFVLARFGSAGPAGAWLYESFSSLFGFGYYLLPFIFGLLSFTFLTAEARETLGSTFVGAALFAVAGLGTLDIIAKGSGGLVGGLVGSIQTPFGWAAGLVISLGLLVMSLLVILNIPLHLSLPRWKKRDPLPLEPKTFPTPPVSEPLAHAAPQSPVVTSAEASHEDEAAAKAEARETPPPAAGILEGKSKKLSFKNYLPPPLSLLKTTSEKPTSGDLRANANIIRRTLESFGIPVEMGEITIGPKVTRYTLKPAEGVKLTRITALNQDLSLALAAHPLRIEAPIPGKSLVGIEVPNKTPAIVRLGSLIAYPEFAASPNLTFALGRDISGEPVFVNIAKMPHLLIAGATGSGKSAAIHSLITSLLYKNSPETLQLILVDPKRVELSAYGGLPHLAAPVITEGKKAVAVLRWAITEMDRRYERLLQNGMRDIHSYNAKRKDELMPFLVIVIDELADLMATYGREVESSIVRLAQMARATGIHLVVSTQRPSVEVITGLIKANITSRIALQVASQIDSRTILDTAGAEKLLGGGDMLFVSAELSKPRRIQGGYVTDEEIKGVAEFVTEHNEPEEREAVTESSQLIPEGILSSPDDDDDELYLDALQVVTEARKASASLLQRRLKVGYARAARLLDILEAKGMIGPGDGAKPREVFIGGGEAFPPDSSLEEEV